MLSKSCIYALRSIIFIGVTASKDNKIGFQQVAEELDLPAPYIGKILQQLARNNIIQGMKGPKGGFYLEEVQKEIPLIEVINIFDGIDFFTQCGLGLKECSETHPCPLHFELKVFRDGLGYLFSNKKIKDLVESVDDGFSFIKNYAQTV